MRNKGKKMIIVMMLLLVSCSGMLFVPQQEAYAMVDESETIMPMADALEWRFKIVNGVLYKRLFNQSKNQWVGDWIKCT